MLHIIAFPVRKVYQTCTIFSKIVSVQQSEKVFCYIYLFWQFCVSYFALLTCYRYVPVRYSRYDKSYLPPAFRKEEIHLPLDEDDPRRFQPIKAAEIDQVSFTSYDALVA